MCVYECMYITNTFTHIIFVMLGKEPRGIDMPGKNSVIELHLSLALSVCLSVNSTYHLSITIHLSISPLIHHPSII